MARVTVEDCKHIGNRFELTLLAALRAKALCNGAPLTVGDDGDKYSVIALREIALRNLDAETLKAALIETMRKNHKLDEIIGNDIQTNSPNKTGEEVEAGSEEEDIFKSDLNFSFDTDLDFGDNFSEEEDK